MTISSIQELKFDLRDIEIFKIPDTKTRLNTLQKYFFPRLERLMDNALELIQKIYQLNPYEDISFSYRPRHRPTTSSPLDITGTVYLGLLGKKIPGKKTVVKNKHGKFYSYYYGNLAFYILPEGLMSAEFFGCNFDLTHNTDFFKSIQYILRENSRDLQLILMMNHLSSTSHLSNLTDFYNFFDQGISLSSSKNRNLNIGFFSDSYYFPLSFNRGLKRLILSFVALYPIFNSVRLLQQGIPPFDVSLMMTDMLNQYKSWFSDGSYHDFLYEQVVDDDNHEDDEFPSLDSYTFTRAGLWWDVLARDKWTCCSCGRSTKHHGITLHVDHILPRSKGGTDQIDNLQALCSKCNIGKSNRDSTDLRSEHGC